jgi:hypothetical protein
MALVAMQLSNKKEQQISVGLAKKMISFIVNEFKNFGTRSWQLTVKKMLSHSLMKDFLPPYMTNLHITRQYYEIIQNTKKGMNSHLVRQRKSKVMMAKDIVCTLVTSHAMNSGRRITRLLGVDK